MSHFDLVSAPLDKKQHALKIFQPHLNLRLRAFSSAETETRQRRPFRETVENLNKNWHEIHENSASSSGLRRPPFARVRDSNVQNSDGRSHVGARSPLYRAPMSRQCSGESFRRKPQPSYDRRKRVRKIRPEKSGVTANVPKTGRKVCSNETI